MQYNNEKPLICNIEGVIFDFNGVLLFDSDIQEQAWNEIALRYRGTLLTEYEKRNVIHGKTTQAICEFLLGRSLSHIEARKMINGKEASYREECLRRKAVGAFTLSPGASDLLDYLVKYNISHTIATSSGLEDLDFFIEHLDLERWFDRSRIMYNNGTYPGKPDPAIFLKAAGSMGTPTANCLVFEDALSGIKAAMAANIGAIYGVGFMIDKSSSYRLAGLVKTLAEVPTEIFKAKSQMGSQH